MVKYCFYLKQKIRPCPSLRRIGFSPFALNFRTNDFRGCFIPKIANIVLKSRPPEAKIDLFTQH